MPLPIAQPIQTTHEYKSKLRHNTRGHTGTKLTIDMSAQLLQGSWRLCQSTPFEIVTQDLGFKNEDEEFWWKSTASVISELMIKAKYDIHLQYQYLSLYYQHILPMLGPRPMKRGQPHWKSFCTDDFSPVEPSWNCHGSESTIRFSFEPISVFAGTKKDPFNQLMVKEFMQRIRGMVPDLDLTWFNYFENEFFIREENFDTTQAKVPTNEHMTQSFIAFDCNRGKLSTKAYFFPILRSLETGLSTTTLVSNAIRRLHDPDSLSLIPALSVVETWLSTFSSHSAPKVEMIAIDCIEPRQSRIKIYIRIPYTDFKAVLDAYTLDGGLRDAVTRDGAVILKELWHLLIETPNTASEDSNLLLEEHRTAGIIFNFEIKPGSPFPSPQLYIPVRHYCKSDMDISKALCTFFERRGWSDLACSYSSHLSSIL